MLQKSKCYKKSSNNYTQTQILNFHSLSFVLEEVFTTTCRYIVKFLGVMFFFIVTTFESKYVQYIIGKPNYFFFPEVMEDRKLTKSYWKFPCRRPATNCKWHSLTNPIYRHAQAYDNYLTIDWTHWSLAFNCHNKSQLTRHNKVRPQSSNCANDRSLDVTSCWRFFRFFLCNKISIEYVIAFLFILVNFGLASLLGNL